MERRQKEGKNKRRETDKQRETGRNRVKKEKDREGKIY